MHRLALWLLIIPIIGSAEVAQANPLSAEREAILGEFTPAEVAHHRALCANGQFPASAARLARAGFATLSASEHCVTVLTRAGRDDALRYVTLKGAKTTPAVAFDTGFVDGYRSVEAVPSTAPAMAALLPVAERCFGQREPNVRLCSSAGYLMGARAARGEIITPR